MKYIRPEFFDRFHCIASDCRDNCCAAGWEIDVDDETAKRYLACGGALGDDLRSALSTGPDGTVLTMRPDGTCPLLNEQGLCRIVLEKGEDWLCSICAEHPRFYNWYDNYKEAGVGLCCEEACRLLFAEEGPLVFAEGDCDDEPCEPDSMAQPLRQVRAAMLERLSDCTNSFETNICSILRQANAVQDALDCEDPEAMTRCAEIPKARDLQPVSEEKCGRAVAQVMACFSNLEVLNAQWTEKCSAAERRATELCRNHTDAQEWFYARLASYMIYRWMMQALYDGEVKGRILFVAVACIAIRALELNAWNGEKDPQSVRLDVVREFSKEIEYSDDNMDTLWHVVGDEKGLPEEILEIAIRGLFS